MVGLHLHPLRMLAIIGLLVLSGANAAARQSKAVEYKIGPDDVLSVRLFDQDPKYSADVTVRPDGKITLALIDDIEAGGLTPMQLKATLTTAYAKYFEEPIVPRQRERDSQPEDLHFGSGSQTRHVLLERFHQHRPVHRARGRL